MNQGTHKIRIIKDTIIAYCLIRKGMFGESVSNKTLFPHLPFLYVMMGYEVYIRMAYSNGTK